MKQYQIKVEDNMSKEDEIKVLEKLQSIFKTHNSNYLSDLFTGELTDWARIEMNKDYTLNIMEYLEGYHELTGKVQSLEANLETQGRNTKEMIELATKAKDDKLAETTRDMDTLSNNFAGQYDELIEARQEANKLHAKYNQQAQVNKQQADEITSLKAHLFDLMTKESR